jgi:hypothetical protein
MGRLGIVTLLALGGLAACGRERLGGAPDASVSEGGAGAVDAGPSDETGVDAGGGDAPSSCPGVSGDPDGGFFAGPEAGSEWSYGALPSGPPTGPTLGPAPDAGVGARGRIGPTVWTPDDLFRDMSARYVFSGTTDVLVTIPLAPGYEGCQAALYEANPGTPTEWTRIGSFVEGTPSGIPTMSTALLAAGTCRLAECGGRCVDLATDSANCGACGHACSTSTLCVRGSCAGQVLGPVPAFSNAARVALDTDNVYFSTSTASPAMVAGIASYPKLGGPLSVIAQTWPVSIAALAVAGGAVFASGGALAGEIVTQPIAGGPARVIGGGTLPSFGWAPSFTSDGTYVYFAANGGSGPGAGTIERLPVAATTTASQTLARTTIYAAALDTDGKRLAWSTTGPVGVSVLDLTTSAPPISVALDTGDYPAAVKLDGDTVFAGLRGALWRVALDGTPPVRVATYAGDFAAHGGSVAWFDARGRLWAQMPGQAPVLMTRSILGLLAADADAIYVVGTSAWRVPWPR